MTGHLLNLPHLQWGHVRGHGRLLTGGFLWQGRDRDVLFFFFFFFFFFSHSSSSSSSSCLLLYLLSYYIPACCWLLLYQHPVAVGRVNWPVGWQGREEILRVHIERRNLPLAEDVTIQDIASMTTGFTGADLANLVNEAALLAGRNNQGMPLSGLLDCS
jgi:hypothetical protein